MGDGFGALVMGAPQNWRLIVPVLTRSQDRVGQNFGWICLSHSPIIRERNNHLGSVWRFNHFDLL